MDSIENVMIKEIPYVTSTTELTEAAQKFRKCKTSQLTVVDSERDLHPVGILNEHGLMGRCLSLNEDMSKVMVEDCMDDAGIIFSYDMDIEHCLNVMSHNNLEQVPVVDGNGRYCGELRIEDIKEDE